ncbi:hypothetical protein ACIPL1_22835 [Pseudomonas sp. NPDC090202]|uniref:hypothetical protein n=1 Tax=Pseudomonas sp. NPDC090202 TaxID=3364476 RepID=UPI00380F3519
MNQEWKLVPVVPTKEMMLNDSACQHHDHDDLSCIQRNMRRGIWDKMIAAAPVPPAGEEVEVYERMSPKSMVIQRASDGEYVCEMIACENALVADMLSHGAHVTRLTAENARLQGEIEASRDLFETKRRVNRKLRTERRNLQSELTEARELQEETAAELIRIKASLGVAIEAILAHQSAPAAKDGE